MNHVSGQRRPVSRLTGVSYIAFTVLLSMEKMLFWTRIGVFECSTLSGHRKKYLCRHIASPLSSSYIHPCAQFILYTYISYIRSMEETNC